MANLKQKNDKKKLSYYKVRQYRLSDEIACWLDKLKTGTWNNTFYKIKDKCEKYEKQNN